MSKNVAAQKGQGAETPKMTIVGAGTEKNAPVIINLKASAEDVKTEDVKTEVPGTEQIRTQQATQPKTVEKMIVSIEEIKRKNEVLSRLTQKWDSLAEKRRKVENFAISHDRDTAKARVVDANGEIFESNNPKTIGKLIEFWKEEFSAALEQTEKEMREIA